MPPIRRFSQLSLVGRCISLPIKLPQNLGVGFGKLVESGDIDMPKVGQQTARLPKA